jgi:tetrahydromethanopterin S-methyltransferase subunit D
MATMVHVNGWKNSGIEALSYFLANAPLISANLDFTLEGWFEPTF